MIKSTFAMICLVISIILTISCEKNNVNNKFRTTTIQLNRDLTQQVKDKKLNNIQLTTCSKDSILLSDLSKTGSKVKFLLIINKKNCNLCNDESICLMP